MGTKSLAPTPDGQHEAWLLTRSGEEKAHKQDNTQSIRDAHNKAKRVEIKGKPARASLAYRAETLGTSRLWTGPRQGPELIASTSPPSRAAS